MTQKHTPGPWIYGVRKDGSIWLSLGDHTTGPHYQADLCASETDARLMVAAPELLTACLAMLAERSGPAQLSNACLDARDAIAKATGSAA